MTIDGHTKRFALLGEKLTHTHSPFIHHALFGAGKINGVYLPMPCRRETLPAMLTVMKDTFCGFNVTIPYKEAVLPYMDQLSGHAKAIGSVNTIKVEDGKLIGFSTDGEGFVYAMEQAGIGIEGVTAVVAGYGGTARTIVPELAARGCRVTVTGRDEQRAKSFAAEMSQALDTEIFWGCTDGADLLVNTTPAGMTPSFIDQLPVPQELVGQCGAIFDAVYNPMDTLLIKTARNLNIATVGGLPMLFGQAVAAQKHWGLPDIPQAERTEIYLRLEAHVQ